MAAVSTASIFINRALAEGVPALSVAAYRLTLSTLLLAPFALTRSRSDLATLTRRDWGWALGAGVFLGLHFITWIMSLGLTSIASSVVIVTASPLIVALAAPIVLREPLRPPMFVGVTVAVAGGVLIGLSDRGQSADSLIGDLLALAGAFAAAGYFLVGRHLRVKLALLPYIFLVYGTAAVLVDALALAAGVPLAGFPPVAYVWLVLTALLPQLVGHTSFNWALAHAPAALATVPALGEPVGATLLAALLLRQVPGPLTLAGAILVLGGVFLVTYYGVTAPAAGARPGDSAVAWPRGTAVDRQSGTQRDRRL